MAEGKNSIIFYRDWKEIFESLEDKDCAELIRHIFKYVNDENPETKNPIVNAVFIPIKLILKRDLKKWKSICDRNKINGSKGGRPKNPEEPKKPSGLSGNPEEPKKPDIDIDIDIDIDNDNENIFNSFRKLYPGTKRGNETEFKNFKKHKDWKSVLPTLESAILNQIASRNKKIELRQFIPEWKHIQTWINQRCWEEEIEETKKEYVKTVNLYYNGKCVQWADDDIENGKIQFANQNGGFDPELVQVK